jgi:SAM-dependent methyltransferase
MYFIMQGLTDSLVIARDRYIQRGAAILDVGCGEMPYYPVFASVAGDYAGADMFPGPNVRYVCPAEALDVPDESFDVVLSTQMLEHVRDPTKTLSEIGRVLRPGGIALVSTHGVWPYHPVPEDYWRWTHEGLRVLFSDVACFDILDVMPQGGTGSALATLAAHYTGLLARDRPDWAGRLSAYAVAIINLLGQAGNRLLKRYDHPNDQALILNYLVVARRR